MRTLRPWPLLALGALLLLGAGLKSLDNDLAPAAVGLFAAGLILLGAWTTLEILTWRKDSNDAGRE